MSVACLTRSLSSNAKDTCELQKCGTVLRVTRARCPEHYRFQCSCKTRRRFLATNNVSIRWRVGSVNKILTASSLMQPGILFQPILFDQQQPASFTETDSSIASRLRQHALATVKTSKPANRRVLAFALISRRHQSFLFPRLFLPVQGLLPRVQIPAILHPFLPANFAGRRPGQGRVHP